MNNGNCVSFTIYNPSGATQTSATPWNTNQAEILSAKITLSQPAGTNCQLSPNFSPQVQMIIYCVSACGSAPVQPYSTTTAPCTNCVGGPGGIGNMGIPGNSFQTSFSSPCTVTCTTWMNYTWNSVSAALPSGNTGTISGTSIYPTGAVIEVFYIVVMYTANGAGMGFNCTGGANNIWGCNASAFAQLGGTINVQPQDFTISGTTIPSSNAGATATSTITIAPLNGFNGPVSLSVICQTSSGGGTSALNLCNMNPASVTGSGTSVLTVGSSCCAGAYQAAVVANSNGLIHTLTLPFTISACSGCIGTPDFIISSGFTNIIFNVGGSATTGINIQPINGFTGTVSLSATATGPNGQGAAPSGATCTVSPTSVTLGGTQTTQLTIGATQAINFACLVTGTSGAVSHTLSFLTSIGVTVTPTLTASTQLLWQISLIIPGAILVVTGIATGRKRQ